MTDLGTLGSTSFAEGINSKGQVVGRSRIGSPTSVLSHAFLWEHGGPMIDLNTLIPANSPLLLLDAAYINDRGEISGHGLTPSGDNHVFLLIPCGEGTGGCGDAAEGTTVATQSNPALAINSSATSTQRSLTPSDMAAAWRARVGSRYHIPGLQSPSR
jgi:probable HAF family extracellular repeat protein